MKEKYLICFSIPCPPCKMSQFQIETDNNESASITTSLDPENKVSMIYGSKRDLGSGQDLVFFGKSEEYAWGVVLDCHGPRKNNYFKSIGERQNWDSIMREVRPDLTLIESLKRDEPDPNKNTSGATMSMFKVFSGRIETMNIGDSRTAIYKNGKLVYINTPHNRKNPLEVERLAAKNMRYVPSNYPTPYMIEAKKMRFKETEYCIFEDGTRLAMSQSLGHNHITGYDAEIHTESFEEGDVMRVVSGSDGLFDMILTEEDGENEEDIQQDLLDMTTMGVEDLLNKVEVRWKQLWHLYDGSSQGCISQFTPDMYDDISAIIWSNVPF